MKKYILLLIIPLLFSCSNEWSEEEQKEFKNRNCSKKSNYGPESCDCLLKASMKKFSSWKDMRDSEKNATGEEREEIEEWGEEVLKRCR